MAIATPRSRIAFAPANRVEFQFQFDREDIYTHELKNVLELVSEAISAFSGKIPTLRDEFEARKRKQQPADFFKHERLVIEQLHYGSPFSIIGRIGSISAGSRHALLEFFKGIIFYDETKSKRAAEAALAWEKVVSERIENARRLAMLIEHDDLKFIRSVSPKDAVTFADADDVVDLTFRIIELTRKFATQSAKLVEFSVGDARVGRHPPDEASQ